MAVAGVKDSAIQLVTDIQHVPKGEPEIKGDLVARQVPVASITVRKSKQGTF
jgi:hypothetical protein